MNSELTLPAYPGGSRVYLMLSILPKGHLPAVGWTSLTFLEFFLKGHPSSESFNTGCL